MLPDEATRPPLSVLSLPNSSQPVALLLERRIIQAKKTSEAERNAAEEEEKGGEMARRQKCEASEEYKRNGNTKQDKY